MALFIWLGVGLVLFLLALRLSHRYAGPLKRLESWCTVRLSGGKTGPVVLRTGDDMVTTAQLLNQALDSDLK